MVSRLAGVHGKAPMKVLIFLLMLGGAMAANAFAQENKTALEFGCKGDGKSDDRLCIQQAVDSLSRSGGGTLLLPSNHIFLIASASKPGYLISWPGNVSLGGSGTVRVAESIGEYRALLSVNDGRNVAFRDVTIDGNAMHNPVNSDPNNRNEHISIYLWKGERVAVRGIRFINGNDVQTVSLNGCDACDVTNNSWFNFGVGGNFDHDSSEVYLTGKAGTVEGNSFQASGIGVRTAIEVHHGDVRVVKNTIRGYRIGVILSPEQPIARDALIANNTIFDVYQGISIWATDGEWDGVSISKNEIRINRNSFWHVSNDESGIGLYPGNRHEIRNLTITNNEIAFGAGFPSLE